jgi:A/G-specific adenine glycosylase
MLAWFRRTARDLPWRCTRDAYAIWISEVMLQQTQVVKVIGYYTRFLEAFPSVRQLAEAKETDVLRVWEGLGYYRRARQLHQAARTIVAEHEGRFPREVDAIRSLPGIGRYTAAAIASIAWDAPEAVLEANTVRVFSRLLAYRDCPSRSAGQQLLWRFSESLLPRKHIGIFNQSLMELGSEVCTPRSPQCDACPVRALCPTYELGLQETIPQQKKQTRYENIREAAVVVRNREKVLIRRCLHGERWAGLWDFPRFAVTDGQGSALRRELREKVLGATGLEVRTGRRIATIKHGVTRFRITLICHEASCIRGRLRGDHVRWVEPRQLEDYPLSVTGRKISRLLLDYE